MNDLLRPTFLMLALHLSVLPLNALVRIWAGATGRLDPEKMRYVELEQAPEAVRKVSAHFDNLHQVPLVFYALVAFTILTHHTHDAPFQTLAWMYLGLRAVHTAIHLTVNRLPYRPIPFVLSNLVLIVYFVSLWLKVF